MKNNINFSVCTVVSQEQLAEDISLLTHCFSTLKESLNFVECFFSALSTEWYGIDQLRLDKFMMVSINYLQGRCEAVYYLLFILGLQCSNQIQFFFVLSITISLQSEYPCFEDCQESSSTYCQKFYLSCIVYQNLLLFFPPGRFWILVGYIIMMITTMAMMVYI